MEDRAGFQLSFTRSFLVSIFEGVSLCICQFLILVISRFGFEGRIWVLIASVPYLCTRFHFPLDAWKRLRYFIVALPVPSIYYSRQISYRKGNSYVTLRAIVNYR